jgi:heterodisulfide reductase subunit C2
VTLKINHGSVASAFVKKVERISGQDLRACYQCGNCSAGCPMAKHMDVLPSQLIRFARLGLEEALLEAKSIWTCVSCLTCNTRCPKGVKVAEVIEAVRQVLLRSRKDHLVLEEIPQATLAEVPPIAIIGSMRKFSS